MQKIYDKAERDALIFILVPNFDSYFSRINFGIHPYYAYPPHLNYYTKKSLEYLVEAAGFNKVTVTTKNLPWEMECITRAYPRKIVNNTGRRLWYKLSDETSGERLL